MPADKPLIVVTNANVPFLEMMQDVLTDEGYEAVIMTESDQAFTLIKKRKPALAIIELLILDPEAGLMIVNKMRLDQETRAIPVIIATTSTQLVRDNEAHLRSKRCDILLKPFNLEELLASVEKNISQVGRNP